jgi:hypothetical protein
VQVRATNRSRNFGKTLTFFLDHIETDLWALQQTETDGDQDRMLQEKRGQAGKTLLQLVKVLAGEDLASWVQEFVDETASQKRDDSQLHRDQDDVRN